MIYKTDRVLKLGLIMLAMKEAISTARKMDMELFFLLIKVDILENSLITKSLGLENTTGKMERSIKANGKTIR